MRPCRLLVPCLLIALIGAVFVTPATGQELPRTYDAEVRYLNSCISMLKRNHIFGEGFRTKALVAGAAKGIATVIDKPELVKLSDGARDKLSAWLRKTAKAEGFDSMFSLFSVLHQFSEAYNELPLAKLITGAEVGIIKATGDNFSRIVGQEELARRQRILNSDQDRSFGLGLTQKNKRWIVGNIRYGTPAYHAGIVNDDRILEINGRPIGEIPRKQLSEWLSSAKIGDKLRVKLDREGWKTAHTVVLTKRKTQSSRVVSTLLPGKIGYIRLTLFDNTCHRKMRTALDKLSEQGMEGLVLDLRNNPGGALNSCVSIVGLFLKERKEITKIITRSRRFGMGNRPMRAGPGVCTDIPMSVVINKSSASASELLSGALKDFDRATIVGKTSYGKGVGQTVLPIRAKRGRYLYMTIMRYTLPKGGSVHETGVAPHLDVGVPAQAGALSEKLMTLREAGFFEDYVNRHAKSDGDLLKRLAGPKSAKLAQFPGQNELSALVDRGVPEDALLGALRATVRHLLGGAPCDPILDPQLSKAIEALDR